MHNVCCNNCGWVHFEVSLEYCLNWELEWLNLFNTKDADYLSAFGIKDTPPKIENEYLKCFKCGNNYKNFSDASPEKMNKIYGSTIQTILSRKEDLKR